MCVCVCVCVYTQSKNYEYIYIYIYIYIYMCVCVCVHTHMYEVYGNSCYILLYVKRAHVFLTNILYELPREDTLQHTSMLTSNPISSKTYCIASYFFPVLKLKFTYFLQFTYFYYLLFLQTLGHIFLCVTSFMRPRSRP